MNVAVFGGTFDPVHNGHLSIARFILERRRADSILFLPAFHPPHKEGRALAPYEDRLAMLADAIAGQDGFFVSDLESERPGKSYTIDTLDVLSARMPDDSLFWIIGSDSLNQLHLWHEAERLVDEYAFLTHPRPDALPRWDELEKLWSPDRLRRLRSGYLQDAPLFPEASSDIRAAVAAGEDVSGRIPLSTWNRIRARRLYGCPG